MKIQIEEKNKGIVAFLILAFIFASMGVFVRYLQTDFTILQQTYLRIFTAFLLAFFLFYKQLDFKKLRRISLQEWAILTLRAISLYLLAVTLISYAYTVGKYSNVSFVGALPSTALLGFILLKEKITMQKVLLVLVGFIGVALIGVTDYSHIFIWGQGELFAAFATLFFALSYIARKWQSDVLNNKEMAVIIFFLGSFFLFITSLIFHEGLPPLTHFSPGIIGILVAAGIFNVVNLVLTNYGFQKIEAVLASNLLMIETIFAVILGFVFFREIPQLKEWIGGLLIIYSAYKMNKIS